MARTCWSCNGRGPFYGSQSTTHLCVACLRASRYRAQDLAHIRALPEARRSRRETLRLLDAECPPGKRICRFCWEPKPVKTFRTPGAHRSGWCWYCRPCRRILDKLHHAKQRAPRTAEEREQG